MIIEIWAILRMGGSVIKVSYALIKRRFLRREDAWKRIIGVDKRGVI